MLKFVIFVINFLVGFVYWPVPFPSLGQIFWLFCWIDFECRNLGYDLWLIWRVKMLLIRMGRLRLWLAQCWWCKSVRSACSQGFCSQFTETDRARIEKAGGECLSFDQLALTAPLGQNTVMGFNHFLLWYVYSISLFFADADADVYFCC